MSDTTNKIIKEGVLVGRQTWDQVAKEYQDNILILVERVNKLIATYAGPIKINDGLRRPQDKPKGGSATSWHYKGAAIDLDDEDNPPVFWNWLSQNLSLLIAWRIMLMTLLGRECPDLPADVLFSDIEIEVLEAWAKKKGHDGPARLGDAVILVAKIGGYLGRAKDPAPGHELMWQGNTTLQAMIEGYLLARRGNVRAPLDG